MPTARRVLTLVSGQIAEMPDGDYPFASVNSTWPLLSYGYWHDLPASGNIAGLAMTQSRLYCCPFIVPTPATITGVGIRTTTGVANSVARIGLILGSNNTGLPVSLITEYGSQSTAAAATGSLSGMSSLVNPGQLYFIGVAIQGGAPTLQVGTAKEPLVADMGSAPAFQVRTAYHYSNITAALPATYGVPAGSSQGPDVGIRFVAP